MSNWVRVAAASDCPVGSGLEIVVEDQILALFNVDGEFFAIDGVCPHQGGPLGKGALAGDLITCPWHGWQFDVRDGAYQLNPRLKQACFPVRVEGDDVLVEFSSETKR